MLLTNLKLYTAVGAPIEGGYLHLEGGKIAALGEMSACKVSDTQTVDCTGKVAYPGFIDAHCHLGLWEDSLGFEGEDGNEITDPSTPHLRALDGVNVLDRGFSEAVAAGVTTVMTGPGSANPIAGQFLAIKTYGRCIDQMIVREPAAMKFAFGENPKNCYHERDEAPITRMATAAIIREQLQKARRYWEDVEKAETDEDGDPPEHDSKCEALGGLLSGALHAQMHAHRADDIFTALRIAKEFGLRAVIVHGTEAHRVADLLAQQAAKVIVGPILLSRGKPELKELSLAGPGQLVAAGVPIAICTDHPEVPIGMLALSAAVCHQNGLDYDSALRAITIDAARLCEIQDRVGSLEVGKDADLLLYTTDPLALGAAPVAVLIDGVLVHGNLE